MGVLEDLRNLDILDDTGRNVKATDIVPDGTSTQYSLVVFLRNFAQLQMQAYEPLSPAFKENGTRLIFVSTSTAQQTAEFKQTSTTKVPGELYGDPSSTIHKLFQLKRGIWRSVVSPLWSGMKKYGFKGIVEGFRLGMETSHLAGDSWQQGGVVLLNNKADILYQHIEEHPADWADLSMVFSTIGVSDVNVNYKQAVQDWMTKREDQRKQTGNKETQSTSM